MNNEYLSCKGTTNLVLILWKTTDSLFYQVSRFVCSLRVKKKKRLSQKYETTSFIRTGGRDKSQNNRSIRR